jgi:hypothetical protein
VGVCELQTNAPGAWRVQQGVSNMGLLHKELSFLGIKAFVHKLSEEVNLGAVKAL